MCAGLFSNSHIPQQPPSRLADLSQTIAGGALQPDQAAAAVAAPSGGPFGRAAGSQPPVFGSAGSQAHGATQEDTAAAAPAAQGPFGSVSLQPPSFGAPVLAAGSRSMEDGSQTGLQQRGPSAQGDPFGSGAAPFGLALMEAAAGSPAANGSAGPFGGNTGAYVSAPSSFATRGSLMCSHVLHNGMRGFQGFALGRTCNDPPDCQVQSYMVQEHQRPSSASRLCRGKLRSCRQAGQQQQQ